MKNIIWIYDEVKKIIFELIDSRKKLEKIGQKI